MSVERDHLNGIAASAVMSYLGWLASSTPGATAAPSRGRRLRSKGPASSSSSGFAPTNRADLTIRPPDITSVPKRVPRSVSSQVVWDVVKIDGVIAAGSSAVVETNFLASLSLHPQSSAWTQLFDQWTIPQMSVSFMSVIPPGQTTTVPRLYTALDFDNNTPINTIVNIEDYSSCEVRSMEPGSSFVRSIHPCTKPTISVGSAVGVSRTWIDSGTSGAQFFGIRSILGAAGTAVNPAVSTTLTIWFAFRNQI